nr:hypothetical protein [Elizabethkingia sp. ASV34]
MCIRDRYLLSDFEQALGYFVKVYPRDYKKALLKQKENKETN